jgi:hypothetical protein
VSGERVVVRESVETDGLHVLMVALVIHDLHVGVRETAFYRVQT